MKLLSYTYRKLALLLFLLMAVWGVLFYYAIIDEVVDETDDTLENYGEILMESALHDPSILETEGSLMSFYKFTLYPKRKGGITDKCSMMLRFISNWRMKTNRYVSCVPLSVCPTGNIMS